MSKELEEKIIGLIDYYIVEDLRVKVEIDGLNEITNAIMDLADAIKNIEIPDKIENEIEISERPSAEQDYLYDDQSAYSKIPFMHPFSAIANALIRIADMQEKNNGR